METKLPTDPTELTRYLLRNHTDRLAAFEARQKLKEVKLTELEKERKKKAKKK